MKKKNQEIENSLTAAQRKKQNRASVPKHAPSAQTSVVEESVAPIPEVVGAVETGFGHAPLTRKNLWLIILAATLAVLMVTFAILTPLVLIPNVRYGGFDNPVVVFHLSNGERIEIIVFENEVPNAATNFIHLARMGFFNDTIIFDTTNGFVRFGQFEDATFTQFRTTNERFIRNNVRNMTPPEDWGANDSPFDFRLTNQEPASAQAFAGDATSFGMVSAMHNFSGTEFQIGARQGGAQLGINSAVVGDQPLQTPGRVMGMLTTRSLEVVADIVSMPQMQYSRHRFFTPPAQAITIRRTSVHAIDFWGKWRTFNWDNYFQQDGNRLANWHGGMSNHGGIRHPGSQLRPTS